jgi:hypothetical protein
LIKSDLFGSGLRSTVEEGLARALGSRPDFLSRETAGSTRAAGDAIQSIVSGELRPLLGDFCLEYWPEFPRRSLADVAFRGRDGIYYAVDVKTHRLETAFNMPNLVSVERLARFYADDRNCFVVLLVTYSIEGIALRVKSVRLVPVEWLAWECLTIGALGWGQLQIANAAKVAIAEGYPRKAWMLDLCAALLEFYPREIAKIDTRIRHFRGLKSYWERR